MGVSINGGTPQNRWFTWQHPIKINDLGVPLFQETTICNPFVNFVFSKMVWVVEGSLGRILGHPHVFVAKYCGLGQNQTNIDLECEDIYI